VKKIIWKGILYNSLEYFKLISLKDSFEVHSRIIGIYQSKMYAVDYGCVINSDWEVLHFDLEYEVNDIRKKIIGEKVNAEWKINGSIDPRYSNFNFIDLSLTPFTNTLPIRNLKLDMGQEREINVIYIDILANEMLPVKQQYRKVENGIFRYQNVPNDFEATISVDEFGLVIFYPLLFERQQWLPPGNQVTDVK
jgi:uncharacterized protein